MANGGSKMYYLPRDVYRAPKTPSQMLDSQTWKIIDLRYCVFVAGFCIIFAFGYGLLFHLFQLPCGSYGGVLMSLPARLSRKMQVNRIGCHIASFGDILEF
ncbi:uncharacterized protein LOC125469638 [Pyrus x bretschneideri]|uniref:uncharacterized protein LOC125469638 n=1 Tax=Pyrus x bretschneideri TaxID=225117 RepID=UPI002030BE99|nr:uncharacterized protein LOC125469638 [Pyrus x bretschneideri]